MAIKKVDLKAAALARVTHSHADDEMAFIDSISQRKSSRIVKKIPLALLDPFPEQERFYPIQEETYESMAQSVAQLGVLDPILVMAGAQGHFTILAGHCRSEGARRAGYNEIDAFVLDVSPEMARAVFHATNLEGRDLLPSQRMNGYNAIEAALEEEAARSGKADMHRTTAVIAQRTGDNVRKIQRYKRLALLMPELLRMVDENRLTLRAAYDLSFLEPAQQDELLKTMQASQNILSADQAADIKNLALGELLSPKHIERIVNPATEVPLPVIKPTAQNTAKPVASRVRRIRIAWQDIRQYFDADATDACVTQTIYDALDAYFASKRHTNKTQKED